MKIAAALMGNYPGVFGRPRLFVRLALLGEKSNHTVRGGRGASARRELGKAGRIRTSF